MSNVVELRDVVKTYRRDDFLIKVLQGVNLQVAAGDFVALMGPSGSGKSTLLNLLAGIDRPSSGEVKVAGQDIGRLSESDLAVWRRRNIGFIFQFYNLIPSLTARENVALVADLTPRSMRPEEALKLVGLTERLDHYPSQMSGGEQQRVAIARAIVKKPEILLCDEPTGALDAATGRLVLEVLDRVNRDLDTSIAVVTHNAPIAGMADRVVTLADGRIASDAPNAKRLAPSEVSW